MKHQVLANLGAAYGTAKSGVGIANLGVCPARIVGLASAHWRPQPCGLDRALDDLRRLLLVQVAQNPHILGMGCTCLHPLVKDYLSPNSHSGRSLLHLLIFSWFSSRRMFASALPLFLGRPFSSSLGGAASSFALQGFCGGCR